MSPQFLDLYHSQPHNQEGRRKTACSHSLALVVSLFKPNSTKHWLILYNPFADFGSFPGANS